ncbi:MAG TPA: pitrilysin family protein [Patescibacteria group bacterium]|nr:pitrilysin family protein [Patescibacteria group bacterium]
MLSVKAYTLANGLRVVWYPDPTHSVYLTLSTRGGPRFEQFEEFGISHFFEHLCVRNPDLLRKMELLGDGLANAETDLEDISYYFSFPNRNLLKGVELLGQVWISSVSAMEFEKERAVVEIEYVELATDPRSVLDDLFMGEAWRGHPLGSSDTILWQQNLPNQTLEQFRSFRSRIQCGKNTVLSVLGDDVPMPRLLEILERTMGQLPEGSTFKIDHQPLPNRNGFTVVKQDCPFELVHCLLGFPLPRLKAAERLALDAFSTWFGDPDLFSAVLFDRVRNDLGLVYGISSKTEYFYDSAALAVRWSCAREDVELILNVVMDEIQKIARDGMSRDEFQRAKEILFLRREIALEQPATISEFLAEEYLRFGRVDNPADWVRQARRTRRPDLVHLVRNYLTPQRAVLALYGPVENITPRILI